MNYDFKIGDIVECMESCSGCIEGNKYVVRTDEHGTLSIGPQADEYAKGRIKSIGSACQCPHKWALINKSNTMSNIKEKFLLSLTPEPQKTFRKLEITNGDNLLTEEGTNIFLTWLLNKNQNEFKKEVCDPMLEEIKENK